jgi:hypothetical protein
MFSTTKIASFFRGPTRRFFSGGSMKDRMLKEQAEKESGGGGNKRFFPFLSIILTGASCGTYYYWNKWDFKKSRKELVFTETNFLN